jgi:hypothetical protein
MTPQQKQCGTLNFGAVIEHLRAKQWNSTG